MVSAKDIVVKPIKSQDANRLVKKIHYSGKVVNNSTLHFGVFLNGRLEGAMSFGNSMDKRKTMGLVEGTAWNNFIELNRMAFSDVLPRNSESRALGVALRMIKKHYPHIEWVISFSDGTQCGDGTIYRASGFVLTGVNKNKTILELKNEIIADIGIKSASIKIRKDIARRNNMNVSGQMRAGDFIRAGAKKKEGYQLRYLYFLNPEAKKRLTVPILPFSKIDELGARMYKGVKPSVSSADSGTDNIQLSGGGASPTDTLQNSEVNHD